MVKNHLLPNFYQHDCGWTQLSATFLVTASDLSLSNLKWLFPSSSSSLWPFIIGVIYFYCHIKYKVTWHVTLLFPSHSLACSTSCLLKKPKRSRLFISHVGLPRSGPERRLRPIIRGESHTADILSKVYQVLWTGRAAGGNILCNIALHILSSQSRTVWMVLSSRRTNCPSFWAPILEGVHALGALSGCWPRPLT